MYADASKISTKRYLKLLEKHEGDKRATLLDGYKKYGLNSANYHADHESFKEALAQYNGDN